MNQHISREQMREFFMQIPAFVDYLPLKSHEFRLYAHYLRVCGDSGECWESVRTTAEICNLSRGSVTNGREALEDTYKLIYTNKHLIDQLPKAQRQTIHIKIRDIWPINSLFLTMVRRRGMPSVKSARDWLLFQLNQEEIISPYQLADTMPESDNPDDYFTVRPPHGHVSTTWTGCPPHGQGVHTMDTCPPHEQGVHHMDTCPPGGLNKISYNKISINKIPDNQISSNQISMNAAAAADGLPAAAIPHSVREDARDLSSRVESEEDIVWWNRAIDWFDRRAMERVALDIMLQNDWRNGSEFLDTLDERELANLLLWLNYADWNYENLSADYKGNIRNLPAYIRSSVQNPPPNVSQRDIDKVAGWIRSYQE